MRVAIIGAGGAGLAAARHCLAASLECVVFEAAPDLGGTWLYTDEVGTDRHGLPIYSAMYEGLRTNIPREVMSFPDFDMASYDRSYLTQPEILAYLNEYAEKFNLRETIRFSCLVEEIRPVGRGQWRVSARTLATSKTDEVYDAVMVCSGHFSEPNMPELRGSGAFEGRVLHSHQFRKAGDYAGAKVLVIGAGPSGIDIALSVAAFAEHVTLSHHFKGAERTHFPANVVKRTDVAEIVENNRVLFADGSTSSVSYDTIICCTGYKYSFPFLHADCGIRVEDNYVMDLYKHFLNIEHPTMGFIGVPMKVCYFRLFDMQAKCMVRILTGEVSVPSREEMRRDLERDLAERKGRGLQQKNMHFMGGMVQQDYYDALGKLAGIEPIWPVYSKLHNDSVKWLYDDLKHFRESRYKVIDSNNFERITNK